MNVENYGKFQAVARTSVVKRTPERKEKNEMNKKINFKFSKFGENY